MTPWSHHTGFVPAAVWAGRQAQALPAAGQPKSRGPPGDGFGPTGAHSWVLRWGAMPAGSSAQGCSGTWGAAAAPPNADTEPAPAESSLTRSGEGRLRLLASLPFPAATPALEPRALATRLRRRPRRGHTTALMPPGAGCPLGGAGDTPALLHFCLSSALGRFLHRHPPLWSAVPRRPPWTLKFHAIERRTDTNVRQGLPMRAKIIEP